MIKLFLKEKKDSKPQCVVLKTNDEKAISKFFNDLKYFGYGFFKNKNGKNVYLKNELFLEKEKYYDLSFSELDKRDHYSRIANKYSKLANRSYLNHIYGLKVGNKIGELKRPLTIDEKKSIWLESKSYFKKK